MSSRRTRLAVFLSCGVSSRSSCASTIRKLEYEVAVASCSSRYLACFPRVRRGMVASRATRPRLKPSSPMLEMADPRQRIAPTTKCLTRSSATTPRRIRTAEAGHLLETRLTQKAKRISMMRVARMPRRAMRAQRPLERVVCASSKGVGRRATVHSVLSADAQLASISSSTAMPEDPDPLRHRFILRTGAAVPGYQQFSLLEQLSRVPRSHGSLSQGPSRSAGLRFWSSRRRANNRPDLLRGIS